MHIPSLVLGVDGGGTKTLGIVADPDGAEMARMQVGACNPNVVGVDGAAKNLCELIVQSCDRAHGSIDRLGAIVLGLAGASSAAIRERLLTVIRDRLKGSVSTVPPITIETDARIALEGALGGGPGAILIAGTGSIVMGKGRDGHVRMVGGWGRLLGDEGSGYAIGLEALKAVTREVDGRASAGRLRSALAANHGLATREQVVLGVYQDNFDIPSLAPLVLDAAADGDRLCLDILHSAAAQLTEQVAVMVREIGITGNVVVVMIGGLIDHETCYAAILRESIVQAVPGIEFRPPAFPPAKGAVIMAVELLKKGQL